MEEKSYSPHDLLRKDVDKMQVELEDHDDRLSYLEKRDIAVGKDLHSLLEGLAATNVSIDKLVGWIKWALGMTIVSWMGMFVWLLKEQLMR